MKRVVIALSLLIYCNTSLFAQKDIPSFGKVDMADLQMKSCSFDNAAEALVLLIWLK